MFKIRTAESVSPKHPDKLCDQISDAILDAHLQEDPDARVAVDVAGGHGRVFITGEVTSRAQNVDAASIARRVAGDVDVLVHIAQQSPEIARGVELGGAGDQGIMIGYATNETAELLPLETVLARRLNQHLFAKWPYDGKTQVTLQDGRIHTVVASFQNAIGDELRQAVRDWLGDQANELLPQDEVRLHINPAGDWHLGGFDADSGLTGRKLVIDNYGPRIPVGGGAFSGKDASKVDRSAAYMARKIAINYLKLKGAQEVYVYLAYAIGYDRPLQATAIIDGNEQPVEGYDLTPAGIIRTLDLKRPIYEATARYGHFGHPEFAWEN